MISRITTTILAISITLSGYGQIQIQKPTNRIKVGEVKGMTELYGVVDEGDTTYFFVFRNAEYKTLDDFKIVAFQNIGNTLDQFYKILKSVFLDENKKNKDYAVDFKLGDTDVSVSTARTLGSTSALLMIKKPGTPYIFLGKDVIDKTFGKYVPEPEPPREKDRF